MKNLIKIKITLPIAIVIVSIVLGGFFFAIQVNKQRSIERQQQREVLEKCGKIAQQNYKAFQEEWNRTHNARGYSRFSEMSIYFNEKLNLCVYEGGIADDTRWVIHIFNAYTNEVLTSFASSIDPGKWSESTKNWYNRFNEEKAYYFEER